MSRRTALIVVAVVLVSVLAIVIGWRLGRRGDRVEGVGEAEAPAVEIAEGSRVTAELYFPGRGGRLHVEQREMPVEGDLETHLTRLLEQLVAGPESADLYPALPPEITVGWVHLSPRAIAYVDLEMAGEAPFPPWGSRHEMLAVYSVVNTLLANAPEIEGIVLLRNGQQRTTFAGHLDTSRPLPANRQLVAR